MEEVNAETDIQFKYYLEFKKIYYTSYKLWSEIRKQVHAKEVLSTRVTHIEVVLRKHSRSCWPCIKINGKRSWRRSKRKLKMIPREGGLNGRGGLPRKSRENTIARSNFVTVAMVLRDRCSSISNSSILSFIKGKMRRSFEEKLYTIFAAYFYY